MILILLDNTQLCFFKSDSQNESGGARSRTKAGIFFVRDDPGTRGTGKLHIAVDGGNDDTNVAVGDAAISITADGEVTMPKTPAFLVTPNAEQTDIASSGIVTVVLDSEVYDTGSNFASNTFTAPVTGKYKFSANVYMGAIDTAATYYEASIRTSNRNYHHIISPKFASDLDYMSLNVTVLADMDASDTAHVTIVQAGGTSQTDVFNSSFFSGFLAC